ncbi:MAG: AlkA N-terminal domain-containing protein, partial [Bacteroidota bacterium]
GLHIPGKRVPSLNGKHLPEVVSNIRRILDLDRDIQVIDTVLKNALGRDFPFKEGTRLPGIWSPFEAGIRAILGQLISVKAAHRYCKQLVNELGESSGNTCFFPLPGDIAASDLAFFKMPQSKKDTLIRFSAYMADEHNDHNPESWTQLKGIGRWTVHYAQMRGLSLPDVYMIGDLGVKKMQQALPDDFSPDDAAPWRSYLTLQLWRQL